MCPGYGQMAYDMAKSVMFKWVLFGKSKISFAIIIFEKVAYDCLVQ